MKKWLKIVIIIAGSIFALLLIISILAGPIAKSYLEKNSKEICNRTVTIDKIRVNLFFGTINIQGFNALEEDDKSSFLSFNKLKVNISLLRLISHEVRLTSIDLIEPNVTVIQCGNNFNFDDIINHFKSDDTTESDSNWDIDLRKINLGNGNIHYKDSLLGSKLDLHEFSLAIPRLFFSSENTDVGVQLKFANGGDLHLKMLYGIENNTFNLKVSINNFELSAITPYLTQFLNIDNCNGFLSTDLVIEGSTEHITEVTVVGTAELNQITITDSHQKHFLKLQNLSLKIDIIDLINKQLLIDKINIKGLEFTHEIHSTYNTISNLFVESSDTLNVNDAEEAIDTSSSNSEYDFKIYQLSLTESKINFYDYSLKKDPLKFYISQINLKSHNLGFRTPSEVLLTAVLGEGGELDFRWTGTLADFSNQTMALNLKNVRLSNFSPYSIHYLAFPISKGLLSFKSVNLINNNNLNSSNLLEIYECKVDEKIKDIKPEINIPLRAALYILTDRKGKISMDLPVKGDISSPDFSFRKIIFKTFTNLIIKVAASPIDFIAKSVNQNEDIFADLILPFGIEQISPEHYSRLNAISDIMKEKDKVSLSVQLSLNEMDFITPDNMNNSELIHSKMQESQNHYYKLLSDYFVAQGISLDRIEFLELGEKPIKKGQVSYSFGMNIPGVEIPKEE